MVFSHEIFFKLKTISETEVSMAHCVTYTALLNTLTYKYFKINIIKYITIYIIIYILYPHKYMIKLKV